LWGILHSLVLKFDLGGLDSTISGQLVHIKRHFVNSGVFQVEAADHIEAILNSLESIEGLHIVLQGSAEAHLIAEELGAFQRAGNRHLSVILNPARCTPSGWFNQGCLVSGTNPSALSILQAADINVAISVEQDNLVRGLIWEAGWQVADLPGYDSFSDFEIAQRTAALVTWNAAKAFGIDDVVGTIEVGRKVNFVVYDGVPGTLAAKVILVVDSDIVESNTEQY
jgi:hypothetical protein